jgi:hypothetical protein
VVELEIPAEEFWNLTWYEWGLYMLRLRKRIEDKKLDREITWAHTRALMAVIVNHSFNPPEKPVTPDFFMKLSFDKESEGEPGQAAGPTLKEMKERLGSRIKHDK